MRVSFADGTHYDSVPVSIVIAAATINKPVINGVFSAIVDAGTKTKTIAAFTTSAYKYYGTLTNVA